MLNILIFISIFLSYKCLELGFIKNNLSTFNSDRMHEFLTSMFGYEIREKHWTSEFQVLQDCGNLSDIFVFNTLSYSNLKKNAFVINVQSSYQSKNNSQIEFSEKTELIIYGLCQMARLKFTENVVQIIFENQFEIILPKLAQCLTNNGFKMRFYTILFLREFKYSEEAYDVFNQIIILSNTNETELIKQISVRYNDSNMLFKWLILTDYQFIVNKTLVSFPGNLYFFVQPVHGDLYESARYICQSEEEKFNWNNILNFLLIFNEYSNKKVRDPFDKQICPTTLLDNLKYKTLFSILNEIFKSQLKISVWKYNNSLKTVEKEITISSDLTIKSYANSILVDLNETNKVIKNMKNQSIRICTLSYYPFFYMENSTLPYSMDNARGFVSKIVGDLARSLNFYPDIYLMPTGKYGGKILNQTIYSGCVGDVQSKKAGLAAGIFTFTYERNEVVDYSYPINSDPTMIIFHKPKMKNKWWNPFQSLTFKIWLLLIGSTIFVGISTTLFCRYSPLSAWNLKLPFALLDEVQFTEHYWTIVGSFFIQGQDFYAYPISARFVSAFWWIFSVIILSVFSADLTSILTLNIGAPYPKTLEEFSEHSELNLYLVDGLSSSYTIQNSQDPVLVKISKKTFTTLNCYAMLLDLNKDNIACAVEQSGAIFLIALNCSRYAVLNEIIQPSYNGFLLPKTANYKEAINERIQELVDGGIIYKWFQEDIKRNELSVCDTQDSVNPIDMNSSFGIFLVCFVIYISGAIVLITEIVVDRFFGPIYLH